MRTPAPVPPPPGPDARPSLGRPNDAANDAADGAADGATPVGSEWSVDVSGVDPARIAGDPGRASLAALFDALVLALDLHPVAEPVWHVFGGPHEGVTGIVALSESHLACHTFPEAGGLTLNLYTCRERTAPDWTAVLSEHLGGPAIAIRVRRLRRSLPAAPERASEELAP
ncbi:MAG: S-adenosylmethionine decarboxylase [Planctomycetota bacterium]